MDERISGDDGLDSGVDVKKLSCMRYFGDRDLNQITADTTSKPKLGAGLMGPHFPFILHL